MKNFPKTSFPTGWFKVAWSHELGVGDVQTLHYFGREMICFRTESGQAVVMDAYCQHFGAHLGVGGKVEGEEIVCPFHGWKWSSEGRNTHIPYEELTFGNRRIYSWPVQERNGMVMVWHDQDRGEPTWDVPAIPEVGDPDYWPHTSGIFEWKGCKVQPQNAIENMADAAHIKYVHGTGDIPTLDGYESDGHRFTVTLRYVYGAGRPSTWLTPDGPVEGTMSSSAHGLGLELVHYTGIRPTSQVTGLTPIDHERSDMWTMVMPKRMPGDAPGEVPTDQVAKVIKFFGQEPAVDLPIWENQIYLEHPPLPRLEAKVYTAIRRWTDQFYPDGAAVEIS